MDTVKRLHSPFTRKHDKTVDEFRRELADRRVKAMLSHARHAGRQLATQYARQYGQDALAYVDFAMPELKRHGVQPELLAYAAKVAREKLKAVSQ